MINIIIKPIIIYNNYIGNSICAIKLYTHMYLYVRAYVKLHEHCYKV